MFCFEYCEFLFSVEVFGFSVLRRAVKRVESEEVIGILFKILIFFFNNGMFVLRVVYEICY